MKFKVHAKSVFKMCAIVFITSMVVSAPSYAEVMNQVQATINSQIKVVKEGTPVTLQDENGRQISPVTIAGTTYLPIRSISQALGYNIEWDSASSTILLGKAPVQASPDVKLIDFTGKLDSNFMLSTVVADLEVGGYHFEQGAILKGQNASTLISFENQKFDHLMTSIAIKKTGLANTKQAELEKPVEVRVSEIKDNKEISFFTTLIRPNTPPTAFKIDLTGKSKIRIKVTSNMINTQVIFGNPILKTNVQ